MRFFVPITLLLTTSGLPSSDAMAEGYDDTRRMACMQAIGSALTHEHTALNEAYGFYEDTLEVTELENTGEHVLERIVYANLDSEATQKYRSACETAGMAFTMTTVVLECTKTEQDSTHIVIDDADCFPRVEECQYYIENTQQWILDTFQLSYNLCDLRDATVEAAMESYMDGGISKPTGSALFVDRSDSYQADQHKQCETAFLQQRQAFPELDTVASNMNLHKKRLDLIQVQPYLIQREWYSQSDLPNYAQLCQEAGGNFQQFMGVLDCIGFGIDNRGEKITRILDDVALCFPPQGCEGYNVGTYRIDTLMDDKESCTLRDGSVVMAADPASSTGGGSGSDDTTKVWVGLALLVGIMGVAYAKTTGRFHRGKKQHVTPPEDGIYMDGRYSDEEHSLRSEELNEAEMSKIT